jgi:hypothetical protein
MSRVKIIRWLPQLDFRIQQKINKKPFFSISSLLAPPFFFCFQKCPGFTKKLNWKKQRSIILRKKTVEMCCVYYYFSLVSFAWLRTIKIIINYALVKVCVYANGLCAYILPLFICLLLFLCGLPIGKCFTVEWLASRVCVSTFSLFDFITCHMKRCGWKSKKKKKKGPKYWKWWNSK